MIRSSGFPAGNVPAGNPEDRIMPTEVVKLSVEEIARGRKLVFMVCTGQVRIPNPSQPLLFGGNDDDEYHDEYHDTLDYIQDICTEGYAEPGYRDNEIAVVTGNWNNEVERIPAEMVDPNHEDTEPGDSLTPGKALELLGCELEWSDEWTTCCDCQKLVRTQADSYGWKRAYWDHENGSVCLECVKKDPTDYIESLVGSDTSAITIDGINLEKYGFVCLDDSLQNGLYGGQSADPKVIGKNLRKKGIDRYIFVIDGVGQFDISFSVWADKKQLRKKKVKSLLPSETNADRDPARVMQEYLQDSGRAISQVPPGDGPVIVQPDPEDPSKAKAKRVSPEDFIAGKALQD